MNNEQTPQNRNIKNVRTIKWSEEYNQDAEVNAAIKLGWQLLLVQPGEIHPLFVLGWVGPETAPQTDWQKGLNQTKISLAAMREAKA